MRLPRAAIGFDQAQVREKLSTFATGVSNLPMLRIYWYDGVPQISTTHHESLAREAGIKLRLGQMNRAGGQHDVDGLIINDMITLARNRAMADCVLVSGDGDLHAGVEQAQHHGVKVHLVGIAPAAQTQSMVLRQEADSTSEWTGEFLATFLECRSLEPVGNAATALRAVAEQIAEEVPDEEIGGLVEQIQTTNRRPQPLDGRLLAFSRNRVGHELGEEEKSEVRDAFLEVLVQRMNSAQDEPDGNRWIE